MPENTNDLFGVLGVALLCLVYIIIFARVLINRFAPVKKVKAVVVDKYRTEVFAKSSGTGKRYKYVVVFSTEGRKRGFYVSEFSYGGYRKGESGTLKYKGDRIIDFS